MVLFPPPFYFVFENSNLLSYIQNNFKQCARSPCNGNHFSSFIADWTIVTGKISIALATRELATTDLLERSHQPGPDFIFPKRSFGKKSVIPGSYQHSWFSKWPFLHYNEAEETQLSATLA